MSRKLYRNLDYLHIARQPPLGHTVRHIWVLNGGFHSDLFSTNTQLAVALLKRRMLKWAFLWEWMQKLKNRSGHGQQSDTPVSYVCLIKRLCRPNYFRQQVTITVKDVPNVSGAPWRTGPIVTLALFKKRVEEINSGFGGTFRYWCPNDNNPRSQQG